MVHLCKSCLLAAHHNNLTNKKIGPIPNVERLGSNTYQIGPSSFAHQQHLQCQIHFLLSCAGLVSFT